MEIQRDIYLNKLKDGIDNDLIKVITGIRGCGKSYLLFTLFREALSRLEECPCESGCPSCVGASVGPGAKRTLKALLKRILNDMHVTYQGQAQTADYALTMLGRMQYADPV